MTVGTPLFHLPTPLPEIVRAMLVVVRRRGRVRVAEEPTGQTSEMLATWMRRSGTHAGASPAVLARDRAPAAGASDAFWSFVGQKAFISGVKPQQPQSRLAA